MSAPASSLPAQSGARSRSRTRSVTRSPSHDSCQIVAHEEGGTPLRRMLCPAATDHADEVAVKQANFLGDLPPRHGGLGDLPLMRWARYRKTRSKAVLAGTLCRYCDATRRRWLCPAILPPDLKTGMQEPKSDQQALQRFKAARDHFVAREPFGNTTEVALRFPRQRSDDRDAAAGAQE